MNEIRSRYNHHLRQYREGKITDHKLIQANQDIGELLNELGAVERDRDLYENAMGAQQWKAERLESKLEVSDAGLAECSVHLQIIKELRAELEAAEAKLEAYIPVLNLIDRIRYSTDHDSSDSRIHELLELFDADSGNLKGHDNE